MTLSSTQCSTGQQLLSGERVALVGKLGGMSKREAQQLVRDEGGQIVERPDATTTLIVVGERELPLSETSPELDFDGEVRSGVESGEIRVINETQLWQRLGLIDPEQHVHSLYTPSMLSKLLSISVTTLRRWQRRGWIVPAREVRRLPYFDFQEVATARRLSELLSAGMSPALIEKRLAALARYLPHVKRPLAQLSIMVEGKQLLLRQEEGLLEPGGQLRFDFDEAAADPQSSNTLSTVEYLESKAAQATPTQMVHWAGQLEDEGQLEAAADMYRTAMAAGGPTAEHCFLLAELLYQIHDLPGARERYYMAIELDDDHVEARANLGCVLAELGEHELAVSAFEGALARHDDYPDVHYHLARLLDELGRAAEAEGHWEAFLKLSPTSPWADEARDRLGS